MILGLPNEYIMMLDYRSTTDSETSRELIMTIGSNIPKIPGNLFHVAGQDWKGQFIFVFLKSKEDEARLIYDGILPYLKHYHYYLVLSFFDP